MIKIQRKSDFMRRIKGERNRTDYNETEPEQCFEINYFNLI